MMKNRTNIKVLSLLCAAMMACVFQNSFPMYRAGLSSVWQRYLTSMRNMYARPLAFNRSFSAFFSPGLTIKKAPLFRTSALLQKPRFLSSEMKEKLLERIRVASNQGDTKTVEQTMKFIEQNVPDIKQLAQQATKEPITQKAQPESEFAHNPFSGNFYEDYFTDFIKRQRYNAYSPLDQVEDSIERNFKEHGKHKIHVTLNNDGVFPSATWKEWLTRDYNSYMDRVYEWIFDKNKLKFTFEPLSQEEKESLLNDFRNYMKAAEGGKKGTLAELEDLITTWDPVCGHMCNHPEASRMGINLFGAAYNEAIKANTPLMESVTKNIPYFTPTNDDLASSYAALELIRKHLGELVAFYRKELLRLIKEELSLDQRKAF